MSAPAIPYRERKPSLALPASLPIQTAQPGAGPTGPPSSGRKKSTRDLNLAVLQKVDAQAVDIVQTFSHVSLYRFDLASQQWEKADMEGSLFVVQRQEGQNPLYRFVILNRISTQNFVEDIPTLSPGNDDRTPDSILEVKVPFVFFETAGGEVVGLWFYKELEALVFVELVAKLMTGGLVSSSIPESMSPSTSRLTAQMSQITPGFQSLAVAEPASAPAPVPTPTPSKKQSTPAKAPQKQTPSKTPQSSSSSASASSSFNAQQLFARFSTPAAEPAQQQQQPSQQPFDESSLLASLSHPAAASEKINVGMLFSMASSDQMPQSSLPAAAASQSASDLEQSIIQQQQQSTKKPKKPQPQQQQPQQQAPVSASQPASSGPALLHQLFFNASSSAAAAPSAPSPSKPQQAAATKPAPAAASSTPAAAAANIMSKEQLKQVLLQSLQQESFMDQLYAGYLKSVQK